MAGKSIRLTLANILIPVAILVFATGFFPYKPFMPGIAEYEELEWGETMGGGRGAASEAPFDKVVFMVVDALRSDFVFADASAMSFVQSLIRDGSALPFTAHATSPTITMPRVKAMTTGSIPSFLDVILNFAESDTTSTLATQDTWLAQIRAKQFGEDKGKLIMYGDDTWLKLFPDFFDRADGTSSFFVSVSTTAPVDSTINEELSIDHLAQDFTEVDNNVTRHVPNELLNSDWNAMIMHYLGLDHIGHKAGPHSPNMVPKQREMDGIVQTIYEAIENEDYLSNALFVLCGDHGMNDGGNHGGSAPGETEPALVFMSPKLKKVTESLERKSPVKPKEGTDFQFYKMIEQSDIAPTLAGLMGFPVPKNNLGVFIEEFLNVWDKESDRIQLLLQNAKQIKKIVEATFPSLNYADKAMGTQELGFECSTDSSLTTGQALACLWQNVVRAMESPTSHANTEVEVIYKFMREAQETMSSTASNYDVTRLVSGTVLAASSVILTFTTLPKLRPLVSTAVFFTLTSLLYAVLMFASSYVEEEHNFWYWATSAWFFYLFIIESRKEWFPKFIFHPAIMLGIIHRVIRRWNQTGQKYAGADDIVNSGIFHGSNSILLWSFVGATYMDITIRLSRHVARSIATFDDDASQRTDDIESSDTNRLIGTLAVFPLGATAFIFKLAFTAREAPELTVGVTGGMLQWVVTLNLVGVARMVFGGLALSGAWIAFAEWQRSKARKRKNRDGNGDLAVAIFDLTTLFLLTQTKAENIPLYLLFRLQLFFLTLLDLTPIAITTTTLLLTQTAFFALGNTNAISSISLTNSYNGISDYNVAAVGLLLFLSNWAGPVYWSLASILLLGSHGRTQRYINPAELDDRDWVREEREYLDKLVRKEEEGRERRSDAGAWGYHVALLTLWTGVATTSVMLACTVLRTHLFIWTVFSPKYLYAMAWGVLFHLGVTVGLGGLLWGVGRW